MKEKLINWYAALLVLALIIYWPLTFHIFSLKNDALTYFLPYRYNVSISLRNGYFPFWSPYIYTGLPLYSDIQSGVWNPVVLLFALFTKYDMSVLQWESMLYILIAVVGFFKLSRSLGFTCFTSFILSISYIGCGFIVDSFSFIPWITSAAYLPFVFYYWLKLSDTINLRNSIKLAIAISLLFLAGYPSFFFFTVFLIAVLVLGTVYRNGLNEKLASYKLLIHLLYAAAISFLICSPAIYSYWQFLPYYHRGSGLTLSKAQTNPFHILDTVSWLFPQAAYKLDKGNDISMRNGYIGILPFMFLIYSMRSKWNHQQKAIAAIAVVCFLFSLGPATPVQGLFYRLIPFMNTFRHPGTIRIFTSGFLLILSGFGLENYIRKPEKTALRTVLAVFLLIFLFCMAGIMIARPPSSYLPVSFRTTDLKLYLDQSGFYQWILVAGAINMLTLAGIFYLKNKKALLVCSGGNIFLMCLLSMGFTTISKLKTKEVDKIIQSYPEEFDKQEAWKDIKDSSIITKFGYSNFYKKEISIQDNIITPTINRSYDTMLHDHALRAKLESKKFAFTNNESMVELVLFTPNRMKFNINAYKNDTLEVIQQFNPNWRATNNGKPVTVLRGNICFMRIPLVPGANDLILYFHPGFIYYYIMISFAIILFCIWMLIKR